MVGLLEAARRSDAAEELRVPPEEIRFAVVLNGGVSLAVWMGGTVVELDRLVRSRLGADVPERDPVYRTMLTLAGCTARADVIAGTSAGGINGAALALCQVNGAAKLDMMRDVWVDQGRIESMLRQPFRGAPTSLLKGDDFFLPELHQALGRLACPIDWRTSDQAPLDLSISTTVLDGNQLVTWDSTGEPLAQTVHAARFHWRRLPGTSERDDPFHRTRLERTAHSLALAARCTASFPIAFEPVFVPVRSTEPYADDSRASLTDEQRIRPDMAAAVQDWGNPAAEHDRSRYVVDGGLLANTPTRAALEAVSAMPADGPVRRVMLLVYPHAEPPGRQTPADAATPPTVVETVSGLMEALSGQGSRTFVDEVEQHNMAAASRRGTRSEILECVADDGTNLEMLVKQLYDHFRRLRRWRVSRDHARRATHPASGGTAPHLAPTGAWDFERIRRAADKAQREWVQKNNGSSPYFPADHPRCAEPEPTDGWRWGLGSALGVADAAADLLRRLVWVLPRGDGYTTVTIARDTVSRARVQLVEDEQLLDALWHDPDLTPLRLDSTYWQLRLAAYQRLVTGAPDESANDEFIRKLISRLSTVQPSQESDLETAQAYLLEKLFAPPPCSAGNRVRKHVLEIVRAVDTACPVLADYVKEPPEHADPDFKLLKAWRQVLSPAADASERTCVLHLLHRPKQTETEEGRVSHLLTHLLQIEIAATTIGDEVTTGGTLPVELIQLSARTSNAFTRHTRSADDKLGGMSLHRFGGFLKRSWRINDWTWGRVDAASTLCRLVLQPARLRRTAELSGYLSDNSATPADRAEETLRGVLTEIFPDGVPLDPRFDGLRRGAVQELQDIMNPMQSVDDMAPSAPALADIFAWALHSFIVPHELPALAGALRVDAAEGANPRSRGELFLAEHQALLARMDEASSDPAPALTRKDRADALAAFDRAGIGREPLTEEGSSDLMIRTAATAAAVAATVIDSDRAGIGPVRPVTRVLRGAAMLPYWAVIGLTSRGMMARGLATIGFAGGAVLLALALFGGLSPGVAVGATAIGLSALLVGFAVGALRSGTLVHALALLTPVVALLVLALLRPPPVVDGDGAAASSAQAQDVSVVVLVLALAASLMVLGSLPAPTGGTGTALDRLADRHRLAPISVQDGRSRAGRRALALIYSCWLPAVLVLGVVVAVWAYDVTWAAVRQVLLAGLSVWRSVPGWVPGRLVPWWPALLVVLAVLAGVAVLAAVALLLRLRRGQDHRADAHARGTAPAPHSGAAAEWAVVYGAFYLAVAAFLSTRTAWRDEWWTQVLSLTTTWVGLFLVLVLPWAVPAWRAVVRPRRGRSGYGRAGRLRWRPARTILERGRKTSGR